MKKSLFILLLIGVILKSTAQNIHFFASNLQMKNNQPTFVMADDFSFQQNELLQKDIKKAKAMKISGIVLTSIGTAGVLTTAGVMGVYSLVRPVSRLYNTIIGVSGLTPSVALLTSGIPLAVIGSKRTRKYKEQQIKEWVAPAQPIP